MGSSKAQWSPSIALYHPVFGAVTAECRVGLPFKPVERLPRCLPFYALAIGCSHVAVNHFACGIDFACEHKLVFVVHGIKVDAHVEVL